MPIFIGILCGIEAGIAYSHPSAITIGGLITTFAAFIVSVATYLRSR